MNKYFGELDCAGSIINAWSLEHYVEEWDSFSHLTGVEKPPTEREVLAAYYDYEDYSGTAFVLFKRKGKLYEVNDGHCSCNGLEEWKPEETTWEALAKRNFGGYSFHSDFEAFMKGLISKHV